MGSFKTSIRTSLFVFLGLGLWAGTTFAQPDSQPPYQPNAQRALHQVTPNAQLQQHGIQNRTPIAKSAMNLVPGHATPPNQDLLAPSNGNPTNTSFQGKSMVPPEFQDLDSVTALPTVNQNSSTMWWQPLVLEPVDQRNTQPIHPEMLVQMALQNSPKILATSLRPKIRNTDIAEAFAEFDTELFLKTQFDDRVDPVGNELTTGNGAPFLKDHIWYGEGGLRRKMRNGGELELKQRVGFHDSNSRFFDPQDQGTATLTMNFSQPLLRGKGAAYNRSQILIAEIGHQASWEQYAAELQDELTDVVEAYWNLYYHRSVLLQKQHNVERGETILARLQGRSELDSLPSQISRAKAAVESRRTELANARRDVRNAETEIRRLIGSRDNFNFNAPELIPMESPVLFKSHDESGQIIEHAIASRPEVKQALERARIAAVQRDVSHHELLPELNLIFSAYVAALRGQSKIFNAWGDQFSGSTPGYALGLEFNLPYYRRAAKARNARQEFLLQQVRHEIDQTVNEVVAEVQIAWRQVDSAYRTTQAAAESIKAARTDLLQNEARWDSFALVEGDITEGQSPSTLLDQLLDAQQRLTTAELTYSQALLEFKIAEIGLKRASGQLLNHNRVPADGMIQPTPVPAIHQAPSMAPQHFQPIEAPNSVLDFPAQGQPMIGTSGGYPLHQLAPSTPPNWNHSGNNR